MIVTITPNPILDRTLSVPQLRPGEFHRASVLRQELGGKGINVTRALAALGIRSRAIGYLGGGIGQVFRTGLAAEGIDSDFIEVSGETRQSTLIFDVASGQYTKINEPGPVIGGAAVAALMDRVNRTAQPGDTWVLSGSLPPGAPEDFYALLIRAVQQRGGQAFLDASETALRNAMPARPFAVKVNSEEAGQLFGQAVVTEAEHAAALGRLVSEFGAQIAAITRGGEGMMLATPATLQAGQVMVAVPPEVAVRSTVGAGDATLAGMLWGMLEGCDAAEIARRGVACGTAAAMQEGSGVGTLDVIRPLADRVKVSSLNTD